MACDDSFNRQFFYLLPAFSAADNRGVFKLCLIHVFEHGCHGSFMSLVISSFVLDEILSILIDSIICEVHEQVIQVRSDGRIVLWCCKSSKALVEHKNSERRNACKIDVNPQVELEAINQVRLVEVALCDVMFVLIEPVKISSQKNAFALTTILRLNDECLRFAFVELFSENLDVAGEDPGFREKLIVFREILLHCQ